MGGADSCELSRLHSNTFKISLADRSGNMAVNDSEVTIRVGGGGRVMGG
jgi:hypothetical protein